MTRREEIEKAANEFYKGDEVSTFVVAAQWADKTMIEKACQWITEHIDILYEGEFIDDSLVASDYIEWCEKAS